jgi:hypothetical protein
MTRLEEQLRATFDDLTADPPMRSDPAAAGVRRAGRIRRTRALATAGTAAAVLVAVLGAGTLLSNWAPQAIDSPATPPRPTSAPVPEVALDIFDGQHLRGAHTDVTLSTRLPSAADGGANTITRVRGGWVHIGDTIDPGTATVSFIARDGTVTRLLGNADQPLLGPDGDRIAWLAGGSLFSAEIDVARARLVQQRSTPIPAHVPRRARRRDTPARAQEV